MISSFPKIWSIGSPEVENLFTGEVEITEKIDGSQFAFGAFKGTICSEELVMRSKGAQVFPETADKLFKPVITHVMKIWENQALPVGVVYYGETLFRPKHNTLSYERVPKNNFALYGVKLPNGVFVWNYSDLVEIAKELDVDVVPLLYKGKIKDRAQLDDLLKTPSYLGNETIEGVVIKNYEQLAKSAFSRECFAKLVRPEFKERHSNNTAFASKKDTLDNFLAQFQTEARWNKAIFRLRDMGLLESSTKDIGKLIVEVHKDIIEEEEQYIKEALYSMYKKQILGRATHGLPEYYKNQLIEKQFNGEELRKTEVN